jgi:hypothetical protein
MLGKGLAPGVAQLGGGTRRRRDRDKRRDEDKLNITSTVGAAFPARLALLAWRAGSRDPYWRVSRG